MARFYATPDDVRRVQRELASLQSLVPPTARAQAVTAGCLTKLAAGVVGLVGFGLATGVGVTIIQLGYPLIGILVSLGGGLMGLVATYGVSNAFIVAGYRRAIRRATTTPRLGGVSAGSSAAAPLLPSRPD